MHGASHTLASLLAAFLHSSCHTLSGDLPMALNKTVTFDLASANSLIDK